MLKTTCRNRHWIEDVRNRGSTLQTNKKQRRRDRVSWSRWGTSWKSTIRNSRRESRIVKSTSHWKNNTMNLMILQPMCRHQHSSQPTDSMSLAVILLVRIREYPNKHSIKYKSLLHYSSKSGKTNKNNTCFTTLIFKQMLQQLKIIPRQEIRLLKK